MFFSVIIPAHNEENTLGKCLESIKAQSFTNYEIIVICDNCIDNTESVAMSYGVDKIIKGNFGNDGMARNAGLRKADGAKNDEFYTQLCDIERELSHYKQHFKGKTIFCNCDDPRISNFFKYFALNFNEFGLKKIITTCYKIHGNHELSE